MRLQQWVWIPTGRWHWYSKKNPEIRGKVPFQAPISLCGIEIADGIDEELVNKDRDLHRDKVKAPKCKQCLRRLANREAKK